MGWENVTTNQGLSIAGTGLLIVFCALVFISLFIHMLPRILETLGIQGEPEELAPTATPKRSPAGADNPELIAAIGLALHTQAQRKQSISS